MDTLRFITCLRFSFQLLVSEGVFLIGRPRRDNFVVRLILSMAGYFAGMVAMYEIMSLFPQMNAVLYIIFYFTLFCLSMLIIKLCFDISSMEILFAGSGGYATEHITFALVRIIQYLTGLNDQMLGVVLENIIFRFLAYIAVAWIVYIFVLKKNRTKGEFRQDDVRIIQFSVIILFAAIILSVFNTGRTSQDSTYNFYSHVLCPAYSMMCCMLVIALEQYCFRENRLNTEKETMEQLLQMANAQQKSSKEAIDIINIKCHDLKHQMKQLQKVENDMERSKYIEEIRDAISIYDATYHTGCEALDYILREKTLISDEYEIAFSCMADGTAVNFMDKTDLYALLGNALDNALEQEAKEDKDKRIISLSIQKKGLMSMIHLENTCTNPPQFHNGKPITTKKDKNFHGFGVKSISYIVEKYDGDIIMCMKDNKYVLNIAIPIV